MFVWIRLSSWPIQSIQSDWFRSFDNQTIASNISKRSITNQSLASTIDSKIQDAIWNSKRQQKRDWMIPDLN